MNKGLPQTGTEGVMRSVLALSNAGSVGLIP